MTDTAFFIGLEWVLAIALAFCIGYIVGHRKGRKVTLPGNGDVPLAATENRPRDLW